MEQAELLARTRDLASALGDGWHAGTRESHWCVYLDGPSGEELQVSNGRDRGPARLRIEAHLPKELRGHGRFSADSPVITVSAEREALRIVTEIRRRLMPAYESEIGIARKNKAAHDHTLSLIKGGADRLLAVGCPGLDRPGNPDTYEGAGTLRLMDSERFYGHVKVSRAWDWHGNALLDEVDVEVKVDHLTLAEAEAVLRILMARPRK